jgi:hypothetical protein
VQIAVSVAAAIGSQCLRFLGRWSSIMFQLPEILVQLGSVCIALFTKCWIPICTNLVPSLVTSSLFYIPRITNQSSVNLNLVKRVSDHSFLRLLPSISAQLSVGLLTTSLLDLLPALSYAGKTVRAGAIFCLAKLADETGRERGDLSISISFSNSKRSVLILPVVLCILP